MTSLSRELALSILKNCFPGADNIRIIHDQVEDGQRHLTSDVTRFIVEYERNRVTQRKYVALKAPTSSELLSYCERFNVYDREISVYEKVMPRINMYLDESLAPAHLYTTDSKILVMEDLTARGFISGEKFPLLNLDEAKGAIKTFAHFHSATHKLYKEDPYILENFHSSFLKDFDFMTIVSLWGPVVVHLLRRKKDHHLESKIEAALLYFEKHKDEISTILDKSNFKFVALNHGDSRKDNFLFKHTTNNEVQVQFVDYQACFVSSPAYDICVFLQCSVSADVLEAHFDDLINGYLHELNMRLEKLHCASAYERADFDEDFKTLKLLFFFGFLILCVTVSPLNRKQVENSINPSAAVADNTHVCDVCLNDEQFVLPVYGWLKYFEKSQMFNEF